MCKKSGESINHLLLHCEVTRDLWSSLFNFLVSIGLYAQKGKRVGELGRSKGAL
jgi:hypothetical protein